MIVPEEEIGISVYWTRDIPGIGGKLKSLPEDFIVEEISLFPPEDPDGEMSVAVVKHRNWEMNRLVRRLSTNLRISRNKIHFAGTKDKRSISTQLMTFDVPLEALATISIPDVEILSMYRSKSPLRLGNLIGNRFRILVREVDGEDIGQRVSTMASRMKDLGGFPNFFGIQRFGVTRPVTHLIGKAMIRGDFEKAVMQYLSEETEHEAPGFQEARKFISETRDFEAALKIFPKEMTFERTMIGHLSRRPDDFAGALKALPRNLIMMFVHAYQSFLFNRILSIRIEKELPLNRAIAGDVVLPLDKHGLPDHRRYIRVTAENIDRVNEQLAGNKGFVSGSLFGSDPELADGEMGEIEHRVIRDESLESEDFIVPDIREASSKGMRRELLSPITDFGYVILDNDIQFSFALNKGCYATSLLREFMKAKLIDY
ncbi:MAG: tRNA pseudouridine(13) synthase TruD [Thermoplasmata archaeon]|nr:tRNA pseudouridine(13) synthase TruD [Thermoplasmata archaeon]